jgi:hypothetical protein
MVNHCEQFLDLLRSIGKRPRMYLWTSAAPFSAFVNFLMGYWMGAAHDEHRCQASDFLSSCGGGFAEWLLRIKPERGFTGDRNVGWPGLIAASFPNEQKRFEAFFELLEEYLIIHPPG